MKNISPKGFATINILGMHMQGLADLVAMPTQAEYVWDIPYLNRKKILFHYQILTYSSMLKSDNDTGLL